MSSPPPAPKKGKRRQSPIHGSPGRGSLFNFGSLGTRSTFESPVKGTPKKLRALPNSPSILTNKKDAKPGRIVKQLENKVVKSYDAEDKPSQ